MGAEVPVYVEVVVQKKIWRKTHGVVPFDGFKNVELEPGESFTGKADYEPPAGAEVE